MPCAQTRVFVAASQRLFHLFTCVHLFPCYWEEGWASTGCVLCQCECVDAEGPALPPLPALPALTALTAPMAYPRTPRVLLMWTLHVKLTEEISALVMTCSLIYNLSVILSLNIANQQLAMTTHCDIKDLRVLECIHKGTINSCNDLSKAHR